MQISLRFPANPNPMSLASLSSLPKYTLFVVLKFRCGTKYDPIFEPVKYKILISLLSVIIFYFNVSFTILIGVT